MIAAFGSAYMDSVQHRYFCRTKTPRISPAAPLNRISNAGNTPLVTTR